MKMSAGERDWELLNAYADQELAEAQAADVERRLARDPSFADELDRIRAVKASLAAMHPGACAHLRKSGPRFSASRFLGRRAMLAAASVALIIGLAIGFGGVLSDGRTPSDVVGLHDSFSGQNYVIDLDRRAALSAGARFDDVRSPDLSASRLTLVDVVESETSERIGLHYRGRHGCRVTLLIDPKGQTPFTAERDDLLFHVWETATRRFILIAEGMDVRRFQAIAAFAEGESRFGEERDALELAMAERTRSAQPCA